MTSDIFGCWLREMNQRLAIQRRKILLFVDNASPHRVKEQFTNIKLIFLPPNCTAVLQPLDQGVIWSFKFKFRKLLLEYIVEGVESEGQIGMLNKIDVFKAMHFIKCAWLDVHPDLLVNSFTKTGFSESGAIDSTEEPLHVVEGDAADYADTDERLFEEEMKNIDVDTDEL